jgi:carbon-monoxide dehydrogenase medium subunit
VKPARFVRHAVRTVDEAISALATYAPEGGRILAGGQSLIPMMAFRLAQPAHLIDINGIDGIGRIACDGQTLSIPAGVRHAAFHRPVVDGTLGTLLSVVARQIAHLPIRTRGTLCGSLANADPASEWCVVLVALEGSVVARSLAGERVIPANSFFRSIMTTALRDDEMLVEARLPLPAPGMRYGFDECSRRAGDYAQSMTLAAYRLIDGRIVDARVAVGGVEGHPRRLAAAEAALDGEAPDPRIFLRAAEAAAASIDPMEDNQVPASLRRDLVRATTRRALAAI